MIELKRLTRPRFLFVYPLAVLLFLGTRISEASLCAGLALIVLGEALRMWANGYVGHVKVNRSGASNQGRSGRLVTGGPYAFVRHPLYLGTLIIGGGFCVAVGNLWLAAIGLTGFVLAYRAKMRSEEALLKDECGPAYVAYRNAVPQLLPRFARFAHPEGRWSWTGLKASKEWKTAIWLVVMVIGIYFWEEAVQEREPLFAEHRTRQIALLAVVAVLVLLDVVFELTKSRRKPAATHG